MNHLVNAYEHNEQVLNNSEEIINYLESMENITPGTLLTYDEPMIMSTETLEDYFKDKVKSLAVITLSSCFLKDNLSSCRVYEKGELKKEFKLPNFRIPDYKWYRQPLIILVFFSYWISICYAFLRLRRRYGIYIGVSHSFALWGALFKKAGLIKKLIYYCLDYYIPNSQFNFNTLFVRSLNILDRFTVSNADFVWDLSPRIPEYRQFIGRIK